MGELIVALQQYPPDYKLAVKGADSGGYDITLQPTVNVCEVEDIYHHDNEYFTFFKAQNCVFLVGFGVENREKPINGRYYFDDWYDIKRALETGKTGW